MASETKDYSKKYEQAEKLASFKATELLVILTTSITVIISIAFVYLNYKTSLDEVNEDLKILKAKADQIQNSQVEISRVSPKNNDLMLFPKIPLRETNISDFERIYLLRAIENAEFAFNKGDFREAESIYMKNSKTKEFAIIYYYLGRLYYYENDLSHAKKYFREAIDSKYGYLYPEIKLYLGIIFQIEGQEEEAKNLFRSYVNDDIKKIVELTK